MKIDSDLITRLERLAAIRLAGESKATLSQQLETIVNYLKMIDQVDTTGVSSGIEEVETIAAPLREDRIDPGLDHDEVKAAAPNTLNGFFKVPKIIDRE